MGGGVQFWPFALGRAGFSHHEGAFYRSTDLPPTCDHMRVMCMCMCMCMWHVPW